MKFDGTNYQLWERKVHNALARAELLRHALIEPPSEANRREVWLVADRKAVAIIEDHLTDRILTDLIQSPPFSDGRPDFGCDKWLNYESQELPSHYLLWYIRFKYGPPSFESATYERTHSLQGEKSLQEFFDYKWYCWKEAGGEHATTHRHFYLLVLRGINIRVHFDIHDKLCSFLRTADESDGVALLETFRKLLLDKGSA